MTQALPPAVLNPAVLTPITLTPVPLTPADTWPAASAALGRLDELRILLASELQALPIPGEVC